MVTFNIYILLAALALQSCKSEITVKTKTAACSSTSTSKSCLAKNSSSKVSVALSTTSGEVSSLAVIPFSVKFSASVSDFESGDITLLNGVLSDFSGTGTEYEFKVTPVVDGKITVDILADVAQDKVGKLNSAAEQIVIMSDRTGPKVTITSSVGSTGSTSNFVVTAVFSESVADFASSDVVVSNGTISNFSGSGTTYTFTVTAAASATVSVSIPAKAASDSLGNVSSTSNALAVALTFIPNALPTITAITDKTTDKGIRTDAIAFTIADADSTMACNSTYLNLSSSNAGIVANSSVVWAGIYPACTAVIAPELSASGTVSLTITVTDSSSGSSSTGFDLVVSPDIVIGRIRRDVPGRPDEGMNTPYSTFVVGGKLFVADSENNRVLVWNSVPTTNNQPPDFALGQPDLISTKANNGAIVSAATLNSPSNVYSDGTKLYVSDAGNNRVLVWNSIPSTFATPADIALGQPNLITGTLNNGGISAATLYGPNGLFVAGTKLIVSDTTNNRALIWNALPTASGVAADIVLGQPNFMSNTANNGGITGSSLYSPIGVYSVGTKLFVADMSNNRVLVWNTVPTVSGQVADFALGQTNLVTGTSTGTTGAKFGSPTNVFGSGTKVFVTDSGKNRILVWNAVPTAFAEAANYALGPVSLTSNGFAIPTSASKISFPYGGFTDGTRVIGVDTGNHRILIWNSMPTTFGVAADVVLGKPSFVTNASLANGDVSARSLHGIYKGYSDGTRLYASDITNHRVLIWNSLPTYSGQPADLVLGQPNFTSWTGNNGGPSGSTMNYPRGILVVGTKLFVVDDDNNRVLVWNTIPTVNGQSADFALGQASLTSVTAGATATTMYNPSDVYSDGTKLFVSDSINNRVLVWNTIPTASGQAANYALGQPNLTSSTFNNGGLTDAVLASPSTISGCGTRLYVADGGNNRVLSWNTIPTVSGQAASFALGQPNLTSNTANNGGVSASSLSGGSAINCNANKLYVGDLLNNRLLVWDTLPSESGQAADGVFGQPDFVTAPAVGVGPFAGIYNLWTSATQIYVVGVDSYQTFPQMIIMPKP